MNYHTEKLKRDLEYALKSDADEFMFWIDKKNDGEAEVEKIKVERIVDNNSRCVQHIRFVEW